MKNKVFLSPKAGQILRSVRVYSPDGKFNAYIETVKDPEVQREGEKPYEWRRIVIDNDQNVQKELYRTKKGSNLYDQAFLKIDDWTKDSRFLVFNRFYFEGGAHYYVYDTVKGRLFEIPGSGRLGSMGISSLGWHKGRLIFREQGARNPAQYYWNQTANRMYMLRNNISGPFKRYALVRKYDKENIISSIGGGMTRHYKVGRKVKAGIDKQNQYITDGTFKGGEITDGRDVRKIRWSRHKGFERIVLDIHEGGYSHRGGPVKIPCYFNISYDNIRKGMKVLVSGVRIFTAKFPDVSKSRYIYSFKRIFIGDDSAAMFGIEMKRPVKFEVFELHNPARIVIDIKDL